MNYSEKKKELEKKYAVEIAFIERNKDMLPGVAFDKLRAFARGVEPCPFVNMEELQKDCAELAELAEKELGVK